MHVFDTGDDRVLGIEREYNGKKMISLFNFSEHDCRIEVETADWLDMIEPQREFVPGTGRRSELLLEPYGFRWFIAKKRDMKTPKKAVKK
jgi:hypothetical protein